MTSCVNSQKIETTLSNRESENCVRELEEKILKINQEPETARRNGVGRREHMCRQKTASPSSEHVQRAVSAPFRHRVKSSFGQTEDLSQLRRGGASLLD